MENSLGIPSTPALGMVPSTPAQPNGGDTDLNNSESPTKRVRLPARSRFESFDPLGREEDFEEIWGSMNEAAERKSSVSSGGSRSPREEPRRTLSMNGRTSSSVAVRGSSTDGKASSPGPQLLPMVNADVEKHNIGLKFVNKLDPEKCLKLSLKRRTEGNSGVTAKDTNASKKKKLPPMIDWGTETDILPKAV